MKVNFNVNNRVNYNFGGRISALFKGPGAYSSRCSEEKGHNPQETTPNLTVIDPNDPSLPIPVKEFRPGNPAYDGLHEAALK